MVEGPVAVGVGLGEGGGVLPGDGGVVGDQTLLHPLLLLHSAVLEPDLNLKPINQSINQSLFYIPEGLFGLSWLPTTRKVDVQMFPVLKAVTFF